MVYRRQPGNIRRPRRAPRYRRPSTGRRRVTRRRRGYTKQSKCECSGELSPSSRFAMAQLDPFDPRTQGAKIPDSNTMPSIANQDTDQVALPTAAGQTLAAIAFTPSYAQGVFVAAHNLGTLTWPITGAAARRNYTNIIGQIEAIRPVAHAIRASSSLAPTAATGFVHLGLSVESRINDANDNTVLSLPVNVNEMTGLAHYKRVTLASLTQSPITAINKWIDDIAFRYDDPRLKISSTTSSSGTTNIGYQFLSMYQSWATIVVMIEGVPASSTPLSFEHILLSEALPKKDSFVLGTPAAPNSPAIMSAVSQMTSDTDFSHTEAGQETYVQQGLDAFARGATAAGDVAFRSIALPVLQRFGQFASNQAMGMAARAIMGRGGLPGVNSNPSRLAM